MAHYSVVFAGAKVTLSGSSDAADVHICLLFADLFNDDASIETAAHIELIEESGSWRTIETIFIDHPEYPDQQPIKKEPNREGEFETQTHTFQQQDQLAFSLLDRVMFHVIASHQADHMIHAAAITQGDNGIIMPGNSGNGKSSFTFWMVKNGFGYATDELVCLADDMSFSGFKRPIQVKKKGESIIAQLIDINDDKILRGDHISIIPWQILNPTPASDKAKIKAIIYPLYQAEKIEYELIPLSKAQAGMQLMGNYINARNIEGHGFSRITDIVRKIPAYRLEYGGYDQLGDKFLTQVEKILLE